jgi:hypothetical protein
MNTASILDKFREVLDAPTLDHEVAIECLAELQYLIEYHTELLRDIGEADLTLEDIRYKVKLGLAHSEKLLWEDSEIL